jgi:capsid protein
MLPFEKTETDPNGNHIRCGIEFDLIGRRVAYHFRRRHPGDSTDQRVAVPDTVRVPAEEVLHIYRPIDAGQIRGLPHVAPAMVRLFLLDQYDDAELDRKKTAAMFAGFITKTAPKPIRSIVPSCCVSSVFLNISEDHFTGGRPVPPGFVQDRQNVVTLRTMINRVRALSYDCRDVDPI